jgi:hypothetical protein
LNKDGTGYWELAERMAGGDIALAGNAGRFRPPAYPLFLATWIRLFGEGAGDAVLVAQQTLAVFTVMIAVWIASRFERSWRTTLIAAGLAVCCLSRPFMATSVYSEDLFVFLSTLHVAQLVAWNRGPSLWKAVGLGVTLGMCMLTRSVAQYLAVVEAGYLLLWWRGSFDWKTNTRSTAAWLIAMLVITAPWVARNYCIFGEVFVTDAGGRALYLSAFRANCGNLEFPDSREMEVVRESHAKRQARSPSTRPRPLSLRRTWDVYHSLRDAGLSEGEATAIQKRVAKQGILGQPFAFMQSVARRWVEYWTVTFIKQGAGNEERYSKTPTSMIQRAQHLFRQYSFYGLPFTNALFAVFAWCGVILLVRTSDTRSLGVAVFLFVVYFSSISAVGGQISYRLRMVIEPVMIPLVAYSLSSLGSSRLFRRALAKDPV